MTNDDLPECCRQKKGEAKSGLIGVVYGLVPHAGCMAFILASLLGMTFAASFFRPLLATGYFFYAMIALSLIFATLSAFFYIRKNGRSIKNHKNYLMILYGSTIGVSLLLYFLVFPAVANIGAINGKVIADSNLASLSTLTLNVAIPCSGHAPLIIGELKTLNGVQDVQYVNNNFIVKYDSSKTTKQDILNLKIFQEYKAVEVK
jgi:hypothetical protein